MPSKPKIVDLFSGCGGFGLGAKWAGFETAIAVDIDPTLQSAYKLNFPSTDVVTGDVSQLTKEFWSKKLGRERIDGLIGGPPCQGFSRMGKKDLADPRNSLIGHFYRHVKMLKPRFFVMENVVGLLDAGSREHLFEALKQVPKNYVVSPPMIVNAADHGAPTLRLRVVVVGYDSDEISSLDFAAMTRPTTSVRTNVSDAIADLPSPVYDAIDRLDFGWGMYPVAHANQLSAYARMMRESNHLLGQATAKASASSVK